MLKLRLDIELMDAETEPRTLRSVLVRALKLVSDSDIAVDTLASSKDR